MQPQPVGGADVGEIGESVDGAGISRSSASAQGEGDASRVAVRLAAEPPLTRTPTAVSGRPSQVRNQSMTSSSIWAAPADSIHAPQYRLAVAAISSASAAGQVVKLGMKAQDLAVVPWPFGRRAAKPLAQVSGGGAAEHGIGVGGGQPGHQGVDGRVTSAPHDLDVHRQRMVHGLPPSGHVRELPC